MKYFLYDENNKRLVLVDEIFPTLRDGVYKDDVVPTPNSKQQRIYNSKYIWENIELEKCSREAAYIDHVVWFVKDNEKTFLMHLPSNDCYIIYGGAYIYNGQNPKV